MKLFYNLVKRLIKFTTTLIYQIYNHIINKIKNKLAY